jgi:hypothetical protein
MDNFDLKKYLVENRFLKEEDSEFTGKTIKSIKENFDGENAYLKIIFTDGTEMSITAYPTGGGGVGLDYM